jgi:hypothetical protein
MEDKAVIEKKKQAEQKRASGCENEKPEKKPRRKKRRWKATVTRKTK